MNAVGKHLAASVLAGTGVHHTHPSRVHANLTASALVPHAIRKGEGTMSEDGAFIAITGVHTGRSVKDKFVVDEPEVHDEIDWGRVNQPISKTHFTTFKQRVQAYLQGQELFVQDLYAGADPKHRIKVRMVTDAAWNSLFARNMFIRPTEEELKDFEPDFYILHAPRFEADPAIDGCRTSTAVMLSFAERTIVVAGTEYAGEIKKSIFTVMNWLLPKKGVMPMHCSANIGREGDVALFFGLSGTGKTTLSSDPKRPLIGDDEHGWSEDGVFNFEGGCYAKVINLSKTAEPEIWAATHRFGTVLENVHADERGRLDLTDQRYTENTRSCYPVEFIPNFEPSGRGGIPKNVVMLACDAFGVLPPIAKLSEAQAMYHFLSGYTALVAGTEKGLGSEPQPSFSACFGSPFLPRPAAVYGRLLADMIAKYGADCWLVNTGWSGGAYGVGKRMSIKHTRALINAALDGSLAKVEFKSEPHFGLSIPTAVPGIPAEVLDPRQAWPDAASYDAQAKKVAALFEKNFAQFWDTVGEDVKAVAVKG
jgi:phosphoenolpyruvate carboxykinase (ATP)